MAEYFFNLSKEDQRDALEYERAETGRPAHLLEKDVWAVWTLRTLSVARTFWEKATAAHVFCAQGRIRSERYARHWHDLAAIARSPHFTAVMADRTVATTVAHHKSYFFIEKDTDGQVVDYLPATTGHLKIVSEGEAKTALAKDYAAMRADEVMVGNAVSFDELLEACADLETKANKAAV